MSVHLTKRELDLMAVVWEQGSATVSDVLERLEDDVAYSTVLTMFRTLESKGFVRHERDGKAFRYYPLIQPEEAGGSAHGVHLGSRELLIAQLVADEDVSADELRRIRRQLEDRIEEIDR